MARSSAASAAPRPADVSSAEYRLLGADGAVLEAGSGDVTVAGGVLELRPAGGAALRVPSGRIASVAEPEPFVVLVTLADGTALELSRLGRMRTQLLEELRDARAGVAAAESGVAGGRRPVQRNGRGFPGRPARLRRRAARHGGRRSQADRASPSSRTCGRGLHRHHRRDRPGRARASPGSAGAPTSSPALLAERLREARNRTAAFLGSLLPGLDPMALRAAAGLLRDGVAVRPARSTRSTPTSSPRCCGSRRCPTGSRRYPASRTRRTWRSASSR